MSPLWQITAMLLAAYLLGSIPSGLIIAGLKGVDIRHHGSGNLGATNVGRVLGREWGIVVLLLDVAKGAITSIGVSVFLHHGGSASTVSDPVHRDLIWLGTGVCCVIGNTAPIYLRFKGGKGVATTLGVILGIFPYLTLPAVVSTTLWAVVVKISRYVSLSSIIAAVFLPLAFVVLSWLLHWPLADHYPLLGLTVLVAVVIVLRHRGNIGRLLAGTENKVGEAQS